MGQVQIRVPVSGGWSGSELDSPRGVAAFDVIVPNKMPCSDVLFSISSLARGSLNTGAVPVSALNNMASYFLSAPLHGYLEVNSHI